MVVDDGSNVRPPARFKRSYVTVIALTFGSLIVSGVLLRLGALRAQGMFAARTYANVFSVHEAMTLAALPLFLLHVAPSRKPDRWFRPVVATVYLIGAVVAAQWSATAGLLTMLGGMALFLFGVVRQRPPSLAGLVVALAGLSNAIGWGGALAGRPESMGATLFPVVLAALVLPVLALRSAGTDVGGRGFFGAVVVYMMCRALVRFSAPAALLALPELVAGVCVIVVVVRSTRYEDRMWARWLRRVEALLFIEGLLLTVLIQTIGAPLDDTLFATAAMHFEAFVLLFALLRGLDRAAKSRLAWTGLGTAVLGAHVFGWACEALGARGMPRGYVTYLDTFAPIQLFASAGSIIMLGGVAMVVVARAAAREL
jgi:hypothetical protein